MSERYEAEQYLLPFQLSQELTRDYGKGYSLGTIQKLARAGKIPFITTPGGHRRFNKAEVISALSKLNVGRPID